MENYAISTQGLTKRFKKLTAIDGVNIGVKKGEIFGLVGPDGAGKTTTIQMLCGIMTPSAGAANVAGVDIIKEPGALGGRIGYMSEGFSLYGSLSIGENIDFFSELYQVGKEERFERKEKLLKFSRLTKFVNRHAEKLSGGMKKKLALSCTLMYSPEILFLDEPTTGVDPVSRREFWNIMHDFISEGVTVFVCTPYMDEAERCDRVALMYQGHILKCDTPQHLKSSLNNNLLAVRTNALRQTVEIFRQNSNYGQVEIFGEELHLTVEDAAKEKKQVLSFLQTNGIQVIDIREIIPSLEDIFVTSINEESKDNDGLNNQRKEIGTYNYTRSINDTNTNSVEVKDLSKRFGDFIAVNNVSFKVRKGEIFGFLGPNGSGKSTTIKMLCGLHKPTSGNAYITGYNIADRAREVKSRIGYMSQKFSLYNDLTAEENIDFYAGIYGLTGAVLKERKSWVLEMAGLTGQENVITSDLSGGWKQRLALGCSILHQPEILFLDEPTSGVDPIARRQFWDLIYQLSDQGVTVFVTTHYMDEAEHCHRIAIIYYGNMIALGSPAQLKSEHSAGDISEVGTAQFSMEDLFISLIEAEDLKESRSSL